MTDPLHQQWLAQSAGSRFTPRADLPEKRTRFERRVRRRNLVEYAAGAVTVPAFAWVGWHTARAGEIVMTLGCILAILGIAIVLTSLFYRASNLPHRPETDCRSHLRAQLEHQQAALKSVPRWYLAPLVPGMAVILAGTASPVAQQAGWAVALAGIALPALVIAAVFTGIAWLNRRAARQLESQIAALDALA